MADGRAAARDPDRLPWLADTGRRARTRRTSESTPLLFWAFLAIVLVAGLSYWLGVNSVGQPAQTTDILSEGPPVAGEPGSALSDEAVVPLPPAGERVPPPGLPDVSPVAEQSPVPIPGVDRARPETPQPAPKAPAAKAPAAKPAPAAAAPPAKRASTPRRTKMQAWPADQSAGAHGRVVRVGTFYSRRQAKKGWARIVRVYPGMRRLRAVVVASPSLRTGQTFYRLQFGTTSQAHSAVLCQRMRVVGQSCVTVGLPGGASPR